jgi:hypothetical protein
MPRNTAARKTAAAAEHDEFFNLVRDKLHMASEDGRLMGRVFKLDAADREGAHLGAAIRFLAEFVVENEYDPQMVVTDLVASIEDVREELAEVEAEEEELVDARG